jgi:4-diphosphocytidyl-2-C-methyl-D-erythritol kinase
VLNTKAVIEFANAKINIGLDILEKRADGFHAIETVFYPLTWREPLEILKLAPPDKGMTGKVHYTGSGIHVDGDFNSNLCVRAYHLLAKDFPIGPVKMHLHKVLPIGAGLGGGSSDAACAIKMLNNLFQLQLSTAVMQEYARKLGSDCAFFIENKAAFAQERGDVFKQVSLKLKGYSIVLVCPSIHVNTAEAYVGVKPEKPKFSLFETIQSPVSEWKHKIKNDFEPSVFAKYPAIQKIKEQLYQMGAFYASMSGSGSSVYGLFESHTNLKAIFSDCLVWEKVFT